MTRRTKPVQETFYLDPWEISLPGGLTFSAAQMFAAALRTNGKETREILGILMAKGLSLIQSTQACIGFGPKLSKDGPGVLQVALQEAFRNPAVVRPVGAVMDILDSYRDAWTKILKIKESTFQMPVEDAWEHRMTPLATSLRQAVTLTPRGLYRAVGQNGGWRIIGYKPTHGVDDTEGAEMLLMDHTRMFALLLGLRMNSVGTISTPSITIDNAALKFGIIMQDLYGQVGSI